MLATYIQAGIFSTVMGYAVKNYHYIYFSVSHYVRKDNFPQRCFQFSHFPSFDSSIDAPLHCNCKPFVSNLPSVFVWLISQTTKAFREVRGEANMPEMSLFASVVWALSLSSPGVIYVCGLLIGFGTDSIESLLKRMLRDPRREYRERKNDGRHLNGVCVEQHLHIWAVHSEKEKTT